MKARHFVPFLCAALCAAPAFAQRGPDGLRVIDPSALRVIPSKDAREMVRPATPNVDGQIVPFAGVLPVWNYTVTAAQDGKTYSGKCNQRISASISVAASERINVTQPAYSTGENRNDGADKNVAVFNVC